MPRRVLIQFDADPQPSTFDAIVAIDAGAEVLLRHGGVTAENVVPLVHGAMFTRGGGDLAATAIFVGGSDVAAAESVAEQVGKTFFGPVRVGLLVDPSGANTTAAAAVLSAARHLPLGGGSAEPCSAVVLGGTGPVGLRVARLLAGKGLTVTIASRSLPRAEAAAARVAAEVATGRVSAIESHVPFGSGTPLARAIAAADVIVAAGAASAVLLDAAGRAAASTARVLVDLNAVPPAGIEGVLADDRGRVEGRTVLYGALGVGSLKMKIHRAAIERIFTDREAVLDAEELLALGESLV